MSDENERSVASAGSVAGDIVDRLRRTVAGSPRWHRNPDGPDAADEIERLRLTDAEREAVEWCRDNLTAMAHPASAFAHIHADTLRGLLERTAQNKTDGYVE